MDVHSISTKCARTEFVGTAVLDTIGLVISGVDDTLLKEMQYRDHAIIPLDFSVPVQVQQVRSLLSMMR